MQNKLLFWLGLFVRVKLFCFTDCSTMTSNSVLPSPSAAPCRRLSSGSPTPMGSDSSTGVVATPPSSVRKFAERVLRGAAKDCAAGGPAVDGECRSSQSERLQKEPFTTPP